MEKKTGRWVFPVLLYLFIYLFISLEGRGCLQIFS